MSHYLYFLPEVLPAGEELVQGTLSMLHVAAVLSVDQEPEEETAMCTWHHTRAPIKEDINSCHEPVWCTGNVNTQGPMHV